MYLPRIILRWGIGGFSCYARIIRVFRNQGSVFGICDLEDPNVSIDCNFELPTEKRRDNPFNGNVVLIG